MNKSTIFFLTILLAGASTVLGQSASKKKPAPKPVVPVIVQPVAPPVINPAVAVVERVTLAQPAFNTMSISKMSVGIQVNGGDVNANVNIKLRKDSAIHISVQFMGAEVMKMEFGVDSLRIFNKMDSKFYEDDYEYLSEILGVNVNYYSLQAIISNQLFSVGKKNVLAESLKLDDTNPLQLKLNTEDNATLQTTSVSTDNRIVKMLLQGKTNGISLQTTYGELALTDGVIFPRKLDLQLLTLKTNNVYVFEISKLNFNKPIVFTNNNPARYIPAELDELIKR